MLKFGLSTCLAISLPVVTNAETYATIMKVTPNYSYTNSYTKKKLCHTIDKPIYRKSSASAASSGDILTGIILGGLLGKGATGKDKGAIAGAALGGIIAADHNNSKFTIIGNKKKRKCKIVKIPQKTKIIKNYKINYEWAGIFGTSYTYNNYHVGQHIPVSVNITAK